MRRVEGWAELGERIREARLACGLSQTDLGRRIGLDRSMISKVESGDRHVSALELARLAGVLELPLDHFLARPPEVLSRRPRLADEDEPEAARGAFRLEALLEAWLRDVKQLIDYGLLTPSPLKLYPHSVKTLSAARDAARWLRAELDCGSSPVDSLSEFCERAGQFILVVDLPGDGASLVEGDVAVAIVGLRSAPGRRRATAAHELGHMVIGDPYSSDLGIHASHREIERIIETFAAELLLPSEAVIENCRAVPENGLRTALVHLAARYRTSWQLALKQAECTGVIDQSLRQHLQADIPTKAEFLEAVGWAPQPDLDSIRVPPQYAQAVIRACRERLITASRAVEMLHDHEEIANEDLESIVEEDET